MNCKMAFLLSWFAGGIIISSIFIWNIIYIDPGLPPDYKLMCSPEGKYSLIIKGLDGSKRLSANVWNTKLSAKKYAWNWEKMKNEPRVTESSRYQWSECQ